MDDQQNLFELPAESQHIKGSKDDVLFDRYYRLAAHTLGLRLFSDFVPFQTNEQTHITTLVEHINQPGAQSAWVAATTRVLQPKDFSDQVEIEPIHVLLAKQTLSKNADPTILSADLAKILSGFHDHMRKTIDTLMFQGWDDLAEIESKDGMLWADWHALSYLYKQINTRLVSSERKESFKAHIDEVALERVRAYQQNHQHRYTRFDWWVPRNLLKSSLSTLKLPTIIEVICQTVWGHLTGPNVQQERKQAQAFKRPKSAETLSVTAGEHTYSRIHKIAGAVSWSFGTSAPGHIVEVGGDHYAGAPILAQYITHAMRDGQARRSHQIALRLNRPIELDPETHVMVRDPVETSQFVLTPYEAKTFLYLMMTAPHKAEVVQTTLGDLIEVLIPEHDPSHMNRYCEQVSEALKTLSSAQLVLPDDTVVDLFSMRQPLNPSLSRTDQKISWALDPNFLVLLKEEIPNNVEAMLRQLNGSFLVNMSAIMRFEHQEVGIMRHYVAACAMWNDAQAYSQQGQFDVNAINIYSGIEWGRLTNSFSKSALAFLDGNHPDNPKQRDTWRKRKNNDRKKILRELEQLEELGLLRIQWMEKKRGSCRFRLLPTQEHLEAYNKTRMSTLKT